MPFFPGSSPLLRSDCSDTRLKEVGAVTQGEKSFRSVGATTRTRDERRLGGPTTRCPTPFFPTRVAELQRYRHPGRGRRKPVFYTVADTDGKETTGERYETTAAMPQGACRSVRLV